MLQLSTEKSGNVTIVRCMGRIVHGEESESLRELVVAAEDARKVVLDLSDVHSIDAGGLAELVLLHLWTKARGTQLKLVNPSHFVYEVLAKTGLHRVFEISSFQHALFVLSDVNCYKPKAAAAAR